MTIKPKNATREDAEALAAETALATGGDEAQIARLTLPAGTIPGRIVHYRHSHDPRVIVCLVVAVDAEAGSVALRLFDTGGTNDRFLARVYYSETPEDDRWSFPPRA